MKPIIARYEIRAFTRSDPTKGMCLHSFPAKGFNAVEEAMLQFAKEVASLKLREKNRPGYSVWADIGKLTLMRVEQIPLKQYVPRKPRKRKPTK